MKAWVYNLIDGDRKYGSFDIDELARLLDEGEIQEETLCIRQGDGEICAVGELFEPLPVEEEARDDEEDYEEEVADEDDFEEVNWEDGVWYADDEFEGDSDESGSPASSEGKRSADELDPDEIICHLRPSILGYPRLLATVLVLGGLSFGLLFLGPYVGLPGDSLHTLGLGVTGFVLLILLILRYFDNYYITRTRAEVVRGIIAKSSNEVRISDVRRIDVDKKGLLGLLNVGDVKLSSAGTGGFDVVFANVRAGHRWKKVLRRVQKEPKGSRRYLMHGKSWLRRR